MSDKPKVSILCITYNHEKYIRQALEGFVMQKTNFPFEIIIHDDASTDGTAKIIKEYQNKYPDIIKPIFQIKNQCSQGKDIIIDCMLDYIQGRYVALNEGDDYWTDENKLQRQVDFLDSHPGCTICFHPVKVVWEDHSQQESVFPTPNFRFNKEILTVVDLLHHNFIQTNSVMYRWKLTKKMWPHQSFLPGDYMLHLIHAKFGKIGFLPQVMSVYRRNPGGIWTGAGVTDQWFLKCGLKHLRFYKIVQKYFDVDKTLDILTMGKKLIPILINNKCWDTLKVLSDEFPVLAESIVYDVSAPILNQKICSLKRKIRKYKIMIGVLILIIVILLIFVKID